MHMARPVRALLAGHVSVMALAGTLAADIIVVAADGSGDYTQINQALQNSNDGDTLLVESGTYAPFAVINRDVSVVADYDALVKVNGYAAVTNLEAHKTVVLAGLRATAQLPVHYGLFRSHNEGAVRVRDRDFTGFDAPQTGDCRNSADGGQAVHVEASADVVLTRCTAIGGDGEDNDHPFCFDWGGDGGAGLYAEDSGVVLYDCTFRGGTGGTSGYGGGGGVGVLLRTSQAFVSGGSIEGGQGGDSKDIIPLCGDGGVGLWVSPGSSARILDVAIQGGEMGHHCCLEGKCSDGLPIAGDGDVFDYLTDARGLQSRLAVREGMLTALLFAGNPGDLVFLAYSTEPGFRSMDAWSGVLLVGSPASLGFSPLGTIDANGNLVVAFRAPDLAPTEESRMLHLQSIFMDSSSKRVLSSGAPMLVLDSAF